MVSGHDMWIIDNVSLDKDVHVNAIKKSFQFCPDF